MTAASLPSFATRLSTRERWSVRLLSFVLWALLTGSAAYWFLRSPSAQTDVHAHAVVAGIQPPLADEATLARFLGQSDVPLHSSNTSRAGETDKSSEDWSDRVAVHGVVAQGGGMGVAILTVDGDVPQPYRTGQKVADGWVLHAVQRNAVVLAPVRASAYARDDQHNNRHVVIHMQSFSTDAGTDSYAASAVANAPYIPSVTNQRMNNTRREGRVSDADQPSYRHRSGLAALAKPGALGTPPIGAFAPAEKATAVSVDPPVVSTSSPDKE